MIPAPSVPEGRARRDKNRDQAFVGLYAGGATLEEIGGLYGITRERVRQVLIRCGVACRPGGSMVDAASIMAAVRRSDVTTLDEVTEATGHQNFAINRTLRALGCKAAVRRLFRWRLEAPRRRQIIAAIQALGERLGRTPTTDEMIEVGVFQATMENLFGSQAAAIHAAGLVARRQGMRCHAPSETSHV